MNNFLLDIQNFYAPQIKNGDVLDTLFELDDPQWINLSASEAYNIALWLVKQNWVCKGEYVYDDLFWLASPLIDMLTQLHENGHSAEILKVYPNTTSPTNKVAVAHVVQVIRNSWEKDLSIPHAALIQKHAQAKKIIVDALENGDPKCMAENFTIWMNDPALAQKSFSVAQAHPQLLEAIIQSLGSTLWVWWGRSNTMNKDDCEFIILFSSVLNNPLSHPLIDDLANVLFQNPHQTMQDKVLQVLLECPFETAKKACESVHDVTKIDAMLPYFPPHIRKDLAHLDVFHRSENAQKICAQDLNDTLTDQLGAVGQPHVGRRI